MLEKRNRDERVEKRWVLVGKRMVASRSEAILRCCGVFSHKCLMFSRSWTEIGPFRKDQPGFSKRKDVA